jgi:mono/diheme cytochrome c family protein
MHVQPKVKPDSGSKFFQDGRGDRPEIPDTVARGHMRADELLYTGRVNGVLADQFPFPVTREVLERGRARFNIYCSPCHDYTGSGRGMIVQRGFPPPPSYHIDRLRQAPAGHFFEVMTDGYGAMYSYAGRITPEDRWAIVAYIRALQLSQHATLDDVPAAQRQQLTSGAK